MMHCLREAVVLDDQIGGAKHRVEEELADEDKLVGCLFLLPLPKGRDGVDEEWE
jgi:hypothetical protein